jgi:hypothetical protein
LFALLISLLLIGCAPSSQVNVEPLRLAPPWGNGDEARYTLFEEGKEIGQGTLRVTSDGANVRLEQDFRGTHGADKSLVVANGTTLVPQRSERTITGPSPVKIQTSYHEGVVTISTDSEGKNRTRDLRLPENSFDNEQSLFLWRSLPFADEYRTRYTSVITFDGSRIAVVVRVVRKETVDTPAGNIEAWRVSIDAGRSNQTAWYSTDQRHYLVRYDNGRTVFLLQQLPS